MFFQLNACLAQLVKYRTVILTFHKRQHRERDRRYLATFFRPFKGSVRRLAQRDYELAVNNGAQAAFRKATPSADLLEESILKAIATVSQIKNVPTIRSFVINRWISQTAGQAAFTNPLKGMPHEPFKPLQKPSNPDVDTITFAASTRFPRGNIRATIWQNASEKGPFFATTFSPPF
jgi:hypothetical protein